jgi:hypothetical protein
MCNVIAFALGGVVVGFVKGFGRPVLKQTVKGGIAAKRRAEQVGQKVRGEIDNLVADARAELDDNEVV